MTNKLRWCLAGVASTIALASPGHAAGNAVGSFGLSVRVPESCDLQAGNFQVQSGTELVVGQVTEACNHQKGFHILASHRALTDQERVDVDYGGISAQLAQSGLTPIAFRAGPRHKAVPVRIEAHNLTGALQVSFSLTAV